MQSPVPQCLELVQLSSSQTLWSLESMSRWFLGNWEATLCILISMESPEHLWRRFLQSYLQIYLSYSINRQKSLKFLDSCSQHRCLFRSSHPFRLPPFFPDVSNPSEMRTLLLSALWFWLGRGMFFLRALEFPKAARWVCLFPQHFKACTVLWLLGFRAALAPDKSVEENPPEHGVLQPAAEEWPTTSASQCQTTQRWDAEICSFLAALRKGQFRGRRKLAELCVTVKTSE